MIIPKPTAKEIKEQAQGDSCGAEWWIVTEEELAAAARKLEPAWRERQIIAIEAVAATCSPEFAAIAAVLRSLHEGTENAK